MTERSDGIPESDRLADAPHPRQTRVLFGHAQEERILLDAYRSGRLPHAWIIAGREGIGKATLAWRFARFVLANPHRETDRLMETGDLTASRDSVVARQIEMLLHPDLALLRREWNEKARPPKHFTEIRVDDVRRAAVVFQRASAEGGFRVCIIDSADDLNRNAANALLKLIEEPPPRSLFLLVAHRPGRILPTIRSRCRMLLLQPLRHADVARAVVASGAAAHAQPDEIRIAAEKANGSVRDALKLLDRNAAALRRRLSAALARLPDIDWREVHELAETVARRDADEEYQVLHAFALDWLDAKLGAGLGLPQLAPYALVWERYDAAAREAEALNLDRRPLILSLFADLAAATRVARG